MPTPTVALRLSPRPARPAWETARATSRKPRTLATECSCSQPLVITAARGADGSYICSKCFRPVRPGSLRYQRTRARRMTH